MCSHTFDRLVTLALFFSAATIAVFESVLQFKHILIFRRWPTTLPRCGKLRTAAASLKCIPPPFTEGRSLCSALPLGNRRDLLRLLRRAAPGSRVNTGEGMRENLQTMRGLRSPFFSPAAWKLYLSPKFHFLSLQSLNPWQTPPLRLLSIRITLMTLIVLFWQSLLKFRQDLKQYFVFWSRLWNKNCLVWLTWINTEICL